MVCPKSSKQKWAALRNGESLSYLGKLSIQVNIIYGFCWRGYSLSEMPYERATMRGEALNTCAPRWLEWKGRKHHWKGWRPTTHALKANVAIWVTTLCQEEQNTELRWEWKDSMTCWFYKQCQLAGQISIKSWIMVSQLFNIFKFARSFWGHTAGNHAGLFLL